MAESVPMGETTFEQPPAADKVAGGSWLWAHAGRLAGGLLGLLALTGLLLLAVAGYSAAYFLIALIIGGLAMIVVGGRIRGR